MSTVTVPDIRLTVGAAQVGCLVAVGFAFSPLPQPTSLRLTPYPHTTDSPPYLVSKHFSTSKSSPTTHLGISSWYDMLVAFLHSGPSPHFSTGFLDLVRGISNIRPLLVDVDMFPWYVCRLVDLAHTALICTAVWHYAIDNYGNPAATAVIHPCVVSSSCILLSSCAD